MLVVADSSPINALVCINRIEVLPGLFEVVVIPTEVASELSRPRTPPQVKEFIASPPSWLIIREPNRIELIAKLDAGEQAAISLASELRTDFLLIDSSMSRRDAVPPRNVNYLSLEQSVSSSARPNEACSTSRKPWSSLKAPRSS